MAGWGRWVWLVDCIQAHCRPHRPFLHCAVPEPCFVLLRGIIYSDYTSECGYNPQSTSQCCACHFPSSPCNATPAPLPLTPPVLCLCLCTCQYPRVISACWPQQLQASPTIPSHNDHSWVTLITLLHMDSCSKAKKLPFRTLVTRALVFPRSIVNCGFCI